MEFRKNENAINCNLFAYSICPKCHLLSARNISFRFHRSRLETLPIEPSSALAPMVPPVKASSKELATKRLLKELSDLTRQQPEGFRIVCDEKNLFKWTVGIFGAPDTSYFGGYFKAEINFPSNYPFAPPSVRFLRPLWHPNVYPNGNVCISILHAPGHDERSGETAAERWNCAHSVHSVVMSIVSMLDAPNISSPANVEASVQYRRWKEKGDPKYAEIINKQVDESKAEAKKDGVKIPATREEYCTAHKPATPSSSFDSLQYDSGEDE